MAEESKSNVRPFLEVLIAAPFAGVGLDRLVKDGYTSVVGWICIGIAIVSFVVGVQWNAIRPRMFTTFAESLDKVASDFRVWAMVILFFWLYVAVGNVMDRISAYRSSNALFEEITPIKAAIDKYVLPRHLTNRQINLMGYFLSNYLPSSVNVEVINKDKKHQGT